jgi:hypothetical protein
MIQKVAPTRALNGSENGYGGDLKRIGGPPVAKPSFILEGS